MTAGGRPSGNPSVATTVESERARWYELVGLVRLLSPAECVETGYYRDPDWSVRDLMGHIGTWLAEAEIQLQQINAGTYEGHDLDIDALNASFLEAMRDQPWEVASVQAHAGRTRMLQEWSGVKVADEEATWWLRKSGADHYDEHIDRLRSWVDELVGRR
jgi:hypothetical protein